MAAADAAAVEPLPEAEAEEGLSYDDEGEEVAAGAVHFPLEGGPPRCATRAVRCGDGVSKQLLARGRDEPPPLRDDKCFGALRWLRAPLRPLSRYQRRLAGCARLASACPHAPCATADMPTAALTP